MTEENISPIEAQFEIIRVQTMQSGAVRVVLEAPENRTDLLTTLADVKRGGGLLEAVMLPMKQSDILPGWRDLENNKQADKGEKQ